MKIKILYEDSNILAIDKPAGISVHSDGRSKEKTLVDWILKNYPKMEKVGEPMGEMPRPGIVHRLDRDTSGVLVLAKNQKTYEFLKNQFKDREIKKVYHAVVSGFLREDRGVINKPIGRSPNDFRKRLAGRGARGELKEAVTEYKVIKRFVVPAVENFSSLTLPGLPGGTLREKNSRRLAQKENKEKFTYLEVRPKTGRTHQIRVHMKFLNHPVVGDSLYTPKNLSEMEEGIFGRMMLHAKSIEFHLPAGKAGNLKGETIKVESPLPKEFKKLEK